MVNSTKKFMGIGNFTFHFQILESFVMSHQVLFFCVSFCLGLLDCLSLILELSNKGLAMSESQF